MAAPAADADTGQVADRLAPYRQAAEGQRRAAFEDTVNSVLAALREAVATRCRCIDERPPAAKQLEEQQQQPDVAGLGHLQLNSTGHSSSSTSSGRAPALLPASPLLILFSGGVDSTLLAALAHEALPPSIPIDLACVCFDGGRSPDRQSALGALQELRSFAPTRQWRFIQVARACSGQGAGWASLCLAFLQRRHCSHPCPSAGLGGLSARQPAVSDWTCCCCCCCCCPPCSLPQVNCCLGDVEAARPRLLRLLAPADTVMDLNIGAALWLAARGEGELLVDAAVREREEGKGDKKEQQDQQQEQQRGKQQQDQRQEQQQEQRRQAEQPGSPGPSPHSCVSAARVVLLGHGADELCGGYRRHRTCFRNGGWAGLGVELALDLRRLWLRNLGRDDRLVADHGRWAGQGPVGGHLVEGRRGHAGWLAGWRAGWLLACSSASCPAHHPADSTQLPCLPTRLTPPCPPLQGGAASVPG